MPRSLLRKLLENLPLKLVSLAIAAGLFVFVRTDKDAATSAYVKVVYTLPRDRVLVSEPVSEVRVGVRGPWTRLKNFDERDLDPIQVDLSRFRGGEVRFDDTQVKLPVGLRVTSITPSAAKLETEPKLAKTVPIDPLLEGEPAEGFRLGKIEVQPLMVRIEGGKPEIERLTQVRTRPIHMTGARVAQSVEVALEALPRNLQYADTDKALVTVQVLSMLAEREMDHLPIRVVGSAGHVFLQPFVARVLLRGPASLLNSIRPEQIALIVDGRTDGRTQTRPITLRGLPTGVTAEVTPPTVTLTRRVH